MTTEEEKIDICFCNTWADTPFTGDIEDRNQVSEYLSMHYLEAGQNYQDITRLYELSL